MANFVELIDIHFIYLLRACSFQWCCC